MTLSKPLKAQRRFNSCLSLSLTKEIVMHQMMSSIDFEALPDRELTIAHGILKLLDELSAPGKARVVNYVRDRFNEER